MIIERKCDGCGKDFRKSYASNRKPPRYCCRACCDGDAKYQTAKATATAATRFPGERYKTIQCAHCRKDVLVDARTKRQRKYCSTACKYANKASSEVVISCRTCGVAVKATQRPDRAFPQYCSRQCMFKDPLRAGEVAAATKRAMNNPAVREKMMAGVRIRSQKPEWIVSRREIMLAAYKRGCFDEKTFTAPARAIAAMMDELGVKYEREWILGHYSYDFYLPDFHVCIEVQGDYWHGNPRVYSSQQLTARQRRRQNIDKTKRSFAQNRGVGVIAVWEWDITRRFRWCREQLLLTFGTMSTVN